MSTASSNNKKKRRRNMLRRKRILDPGTVIDYRLPEVLKRFITDRGKIIPRRISGASARQQREISVAVKRARFLALLPASAAHETERGFAGEMQNAAQSFAAASIRTQRPAPRPPLRREEGGPGEPTAMMADPVSKASPSTE